MMDPNAAMETLRMLADINDDQGMFIFKVRLF